MNKEGGQLEDWQKRTGRNQRRRKNVQQSSAQGSTRQTWQGKKSPDEMLKAGKGKIEQHFVSQIIFMQPGSELNCYIYYSGMFCHIRVLPLGLPIPPDTLISIVLAISLPVTYSQVIRKIKPGNFTFLNTLHLDERKKTGRNQPFCLTSDFSRNTGCQVPFFLVVCLKKWGRALHKDWEQSLSHESPSYLDEKILQLKSTPAPKSPPNLICYLIKGTHGVGSFCIITLHCSLSQQDYMN